MSLFNNIKVSTKRVWGEESNLNPTSCSFAAIGVVIRCGFNRVIDDLLPSVLTLKKDVVNVFLT